MTKDIRYQCSLRKGENERSKGDRKNGRRVKVAESEDMELTSPHIKSTPTCGINLTGN